MTPTSPAPAPAVSPTATRDAILEKRRTPGNWLRSHKIEVSEFGDVVAVILNCAWRGLYHMPDILLKADWKHPSYIEVKVNGWLATQDDNQLTTLVVLCHDLCVRLEIKPCNPQYITLCFCRRQRIPCNMDGHLEIEPHIARIREKCGAGIVPAAAPSPLTA